MWAYDFKVNGIYYHITSSSPLRVAVTWESISSNSYSGTVTIPQSVIYNSKTYSVTSIENSAFSECSGLTAVTIPSSVTSIGGYAFYNCYNLNSIAIPEGVKTIGDRAFCRCNSFPATVTIPESVTSIGEYVFAGCNSLSTVNFNAINVTYTALDSESLFAGCPALKTLNIGEKVKIIPDYFLDNCDGITSISIPSSVTSIGVAAFYDCSKLSSVTILDGVTSIGGSAFYGCIKLTTISIPSTVTYIGSSAFKDCSSLTSIFANNISPSNITMGSFVFNGVNTPIATLYVPIGSKSAYQVANQWKDFFTIKEELASTIFETLSSSVKIKIENGKAVLYGVPLEEQIAAYNMQGAVIYNDKAKSDIVAISFPIHGVYVVRIGAKTIKVVY